MNKVLTVLATLFSLSAVAGEGIAPTTYVCDGSRKTVVSYETTSFSGRPLFHVTFKGETVKLPAFPEVRTQATVLGTLATVTDARLSLVDGPSYHYTLVVPMIELANAQEEVKFESFLIKTTVVNPFFHAPNTSVSQDNEMVPVQCTASFVVS